MDTKRKKPMRPFKVALLCAVLGFFVGLLILAMVYFAHIKIVNGVPILLQYAMFAPIIFALFHGILGYVIGVFTARIHDNIPSGNEDTVV